MQDQGAETGIMRWRGVVPALLLLALVLLAWRAAQAIAAAVAVIPFPLSLDYGEGIVVQQALLITSADAYGSLNEPPFIVFHYPPVYLFFLRPIGWSLDATPGDLVTVGRAVSVISAVVAALAMGFLAARLSPADLPRRWRVVAGAAAALLAIGSVPFTAWMAFARVDMLGLALTLCGLALAATGPPSRARIGCAVLLFTLAVFTRQTFVAAPIAVVAVLAIVDRRIAVFAVALGLGVSLALLGAAQYLTDGGFLAHVVGHNVNRFELSRLGLVVLVVSLHFPMIVAIAAGLGLRPAVHAISNEPLPLRLHSDAGARGRAMLGVSFALASLMLPAMSKSGSNLNYAMEWAAMGAAFAGIAFGRAVVLTSRNAFGIQRSHQVRASAIAVALLVQPFMLPDSRRSLPQGDPAAFAAMANSLTAAIRNASGSTISDDMVVILRAGKTVPWEPAIFAELASLGRWDERLITAEIESGRVGMAITHGQRGELLFDGRYNAAVANALDAALPVKARIHWLILHLPAGSSVPDGAEAVARP